MAHSSQPRLRTRSAKRTVIWNDGPNSTVVQSLSAAVNTVWTLGQTALGGVTIVRIRGSIGLWLETATAIGDGFTRVSIGIGIVTADAFSTGVGAMPGVISDKNWGGWMFYSDLGPFIGLSVTEGENTSPLAQVRVPIDTKAMRKVAPNETVFGMVSASAEIGAATLSFVGDTRMLVKLS